MTKLVTESSNWRQNLLHEQLIHGLTNGNQNNSSILLKPNLIIPIRTTTSPAKNGNNGETLS